MKTTKLVEERARVVAAANARYLRKTGTVLVCFALLYATCQLLPGAARHFASYVADIVPSVRSLRDAGNQVNEAAYPLFGLLAPLVPILSVFLAWNSDVLARFRDGVSRSGRSLVENLIVIYCICLPALIGVVLYLWFAEVQPSRTSNTGGSALVSFMLTTDIGLFVVGLLFFTSLVLFLSLMLMALWMPIAFKFTNAAVNQGGR